MPTDDADTPPTESETATDEHAAHALLAGEIFRQQLRRRNKTRVQVQREAGVPRSVISRWERGERFPHDPLLIMRVANYLNISPDLLMGWEHYKQRKNDDGTE